MENILFFCRDFSYTAISKFPTNGLRRLTELNLYGCKDLKVFPNAIGNYDPELCTNVTFPFLKKVMFEYHAHCCTYSRTKPLKICPKIVNGKCNDTIITLTGSIGVSNNTVNYVCINATDGTSVSGYTPTDGEIYTLSELCLLIPYCFDNRCHDNCINDPGFSGSGDFVGMACIVESNVFPTPSPSLSSSETFVTSLIEVSSSSNIFSILHTTICWSGSVIISSTPSTIVQSPTPTISESPINYEECPTVECDDCVVQECMDMSCSDYVPYCEAQEKKRKKRLVDEILCSTIDVTLTPKINVLCSTTVQFTVPTPTVTSTSSSPSPSPTECPESNTVCQDCVVEECMEPHCNEFQVYCDNEDRRRREITLCSSQEYPCVSFSLACLSPSPSPSTSTSFTTTTAFPTQTPESECPDGDTDCQDCVAEGCVRNECAMYQSICDAQKRKRRRRNEESDIDSAKCSVTAIIGNCISENPPQPSSTITTISSITPIPPPSSSTVAPLACTPDIFLSNPCEAYVEVDEYTECSPGNDPFNPCFDILDDDILRGAIWIVILIAIGGNSLVISVTILHWIYRYRSSRKEPHLLYVLYLNLAMADLFMGIYLLTIAVVDVETKGSYSEKAIAWQTGHGCRFAGFCAIVSSILSVYTLLVITVERVYSIKFSLQRKHFKKHWVCFFMIIGWVIGISLAVLPMVGLSSYERVSICLPFESREIEDKAYIATILVLTGLASFVILFSYVYLFYIVACGTRKKNLHGSLTAREELKLALRMSLLIVTDFMCWGPIAFFGLTAVFGQPLIGIKASKVLIVFVFPLNSCLNPILYSFSTRLFRQNVKNLFDKCGLCTTCKHYLKTQHSTGYIQNSTQSRDEPHYHSRRRSTQISVMSRLLSISSSFGGDGSRRGSAFSGSSEEGSSIFRSSTPPPPIDGLPNRTSKDRRISQVSLSGQLNVLPEEDEDTVITNEDAVIYNRSRNASSDSSFDLQLNYVSHYIGNGDCRHDDYSDEKVLQLESTVNRNGLKIKQTNLTEVDNQSKDGREPATNPRRQSLPTILDVQENYDDFETEDSSSRQNVLYNAYTGDDEDDGFIMRIIEKGTIINQNSQNETQEQEVTFM